MNKNIDTKHNSTISKPKSLSDAGLPPTVWELAQLPDELTQPLGVSIISDSLTSGGIDKLVGNSGAITLLNNDDFAAKSNSKFSLDSGVGVSNQFGQPNISITNNEPINITIASASIDPNFDITTPGIVTGGTRRGAPDDIILNPNERQINFNLRGERGTGQTWAIMHGWNGDINQFNALADIVKDARPGDMVLTLDWRQAAETIGNEVVGLARRNNYNAAT